MTPPLELTGQRFDRLLVIRRAEIRNQRTYWLCRCDCGAETVVVGTSLRYGATRSCGCLQRIAATRHGMWKMPEYGIWRTMKNRCLNPRAERFDRYGPLGFHDGWVDDFPAFLAEIGPRPSPDHSVDRIDNSRGYFPGNIRWATRSEQQRNKH